VTTATAVLILGMGGLGDSIYQRPFVRAQAELHDELFLRTPWPELYRDIDNLRAVEPRPMHLRTQKKNIERLPEEAWAERPDGIPTLTAGYSFHEPGATIVQEMEKRVPLGGRPFRFDLPDFGRSPARWERPYAVLRPATVRNEWRNFARNAQSEYLAAAAQALQEAGYRVVVVADLEEGEEWAVGELPPADRSWIHGELHVDQLMALVQHAAVAVGGVGWLVPAAIALRTPLVVIGGGGGAHNAPEAVTDPRMDLSRVRWILPDEYCLCKGMDHDCPREISGFGERFTRAVQELRL
jgi:hypothetical protein